LRTDYTRVFWQKGTLGENGPSLGKSGGKTAHLWGY